MEICVQSIEDDLNIRERERGKEEKKERGGYSVPFHWFWDLIWPRDLHLFIQLNWQWTQQCFQLVKFRPRLCLLSFSSWFSQTLAMTKKRTRSLPFSLSFDVPLSVSFNPVFELKNKVPSGEGTIHEDRVFSTETPKIIRGPEKEWEWDSFDTWEYCVNLVYMLTLWVKLKVLFGQMGTRLTHLTLRIPLTVSFCEHYVGNLSDL